MFKAAGHALPLLMVIIVLDYFKTCFGGIAEAFIEPHVVLSPRENIGIAEEYDGAEALIHKAFHYCRRAGGAAGMKQDPVARRAQDKALFAVAFHSLTFLRLGRQRP